MFHMRGQGAATFSSSDHQIAGHRLDERQVVYRYAGRPLAMAGWTLAAAMAGGILAAIKYMASQPQFPFFRGGPFGVEFYGFIAAVSVVMAMGLGLLAINAVVSKRRLVLTATHIVTPMSPLIWVTKERVIEYAAVRQAGWEHVGKDKILRIHHAGGTFEIERAQMRSDVEFEDVFNLLLGSLELAYRRRQAQKAGGPVA
jgi:hypothetical protein